MLIFPQILLTLIHLEKYQPNHLINVTMDHLNARLIFLPNKVPTMLGI